MIEWLIPIGILVAVFGLIWWDTVNDPLLGKDRSSHRQDSEKHEDLCQ